MNLETAGAETPAAADAIADAAPVENSEATTETQQDADESEASAGPDTTGDEAESSPGDDAADKPKRKHWAHQRIDELTRQRREAERQAEYWKAKAEQQDVNLDDLDYEDGIAERVRKANRQEQYETAQASAAQLASEAFGYREAEARERFADYDAVVKNPNLPITDNMAVVIQDSDLGPDIAYHLGRNPADAARIASLNPARQAAEIGRLEAKLSAPKAPPKIPASPVKPVGGQAQPGMKEPAEMSMSEYIAARKAGKI